MVFSLFNLEKRADLLLFHTEETAMETLSAWSVDNKRRKSLFSPNLYVVTTVYFASDYLLV